VREAPPMLERSNAPSPSANVTTHSCLYKCLIFACLAVVLHLLFFVGLFLAYIGITAVMSLKVTTLKLSYLVWSIILFGAGLAFLILIQCLCEIVQVNHNIDALRQANHGKRMELMGKMIRASTVFLSDELVESTIARPTEAGLNKVAGICPEIEEIEDDAHRKKLQASNLDYSTLRRFIDNDAFVEKLLCDAGIKTPGERLSIMIALKDKDKEEITSQSTAKVSSGLQPKVPEGSQPWSSFTQGAVAASARLFTPVAISENELKA
jgi:uncharacterized membrane protein